MDRRERIAILGFGDPAAGGYISAIEPTELERSWQFIRPDGTRLTAGTAAVELMNSVDATRWLGRLVTTLHLTWLVGLIYRAVSIGRGRLGRLVKDAPGPRRLP